MSFLHRASSKNSSPAAKAARQAILRLYKDCLLCVGAIPDASQRYEYLQYTRQGFRDKAGLDSPRALQAVADAREQLERMNYFHSVVQQQEQEQQQEQGNEVKKEVGAIQGNGDENDNKSDNHDSGVIVDDKRTQQLQLLKSWLLHALPDLHPDDEAVYATRLIRDGFDTLALLQPEFLAVDDLSFMKRAHQRALVRVYQLE